MKKESTTFGLSLKKVVKLLNIGSDISTAASDTDQQKAGLLSDRLNETLPLFASTKEKLTKKLERLRRTIEALAGEPIGKLLQDPKTDIAIIRMIKDYGRKLSTHANSEDEHHASNTIYYAAIAHALVYYDLRITKFSYKDLQHSFCHLSQEKWIPEGLLGLFTKASKCCEAKMK